MSELTQGRAWQSLQEHAGVIRERRIADLYAADPERASRYHASACGLQLDYGKQALDDRALALLFELAESRDLKGWIEKLYTGEKVNHTEARAALHMALRAPEGARFRADGEGVGEAVQAVRMRFCTFAETVRDGRWQAADGGRITDVVNIGIGGSDLGPRMVCEALAPFADGPRTHFIANVDAAERSAVLARCDPARTLVIVTSKTFTTQETMANARAARHWLTAALDEAAVARHFVAVSTNIEAARAFGIETDNIFGFWDWVGGRYSLWSAVGLPIAIALGQQGFDALLQGAADMDTHFREAPLDGNLPVLMGLIGVWNTNFMGRATQVVAPYAQQLGRFVAWLQQLEMESNGKSVDHAGERVDYATTPALWGDVGTNAQHAFFQMLHQGPAVHSVDFILPLAGRHGDAAQQRMLVANCLAQSAALMLGKDAAAVEAELRVRGLSGDALSAAVPHRVFAGNRPSNTLLMPSVDPYHLGALLALYEHRSFVQSVIWQINPFDQWGVELGKQLAGQVLAALQPDARQAAEAEQRLDPATRALVQHIYTSIY
jgi:glucose-6-phosphate isomerase